MGSLRFCLFGKFTLFNDGQIVEGLEFQKAQELFCYLLLHRHQPQVREKLAAMLWEDLSTAKSKRYLRQALWQLQSTLNDINGAGTSILSVDSDWLQVNQATDFWLDVERFEQAYVVAQGQRGRELDASQVYVLQEAVRLYRGDLLENWYQDWCLFERERLQNMYLAILDKLMSYCEVHHDFEMGIACGAKILRCDYARERTHRRLMRLYYLAGDRTGALRQYRKCADALKNELDVEPSYPTTTLYNQVRQAGPVTLPSSAKVDTESTTSAPLSFETLASLSQLQETLAGIQQQLEREIEAVKLILNNQR